MINNLLRFYHTKINKIFIRNIFYRNRVCIFIKFLANTTIYNNFNFICISYFERRICCKGWGVLFKTSSRMGQTKSRTRGNWKNK